MQDYSYIYLPGMVLSNPGITPRSHNLKQLINAPGLFTQRKYITVKSRIQYLFFTSCMFRFASVKSAITGLLRLISKVKTVNI